MCKSEWFIIKTVWGDRCFPYPSTRWGTVTRLCPFATEMGIFLPLQISIIGLSPPMLLHSPQGFVHVVWCLFASVMGAWCGCLKKLSFFNLKIFIHKKNIKWKRFLSCMNNTTCAYSITPICTPMGKGLSFIKKIST